LFSISTFFFDFIFFDFFLGYPQAISSLKKLDETEARMRMEESKKKSHGIFGNSDLAAEGDMLTMLSAMSGEMEELEMVE